MVHVLVLIIFYCFGFIHVTWSSIYHWSGRLEVFLLPLIFLKLDLLIAIQSMWCQWASAGYRDLQFLPRWFVDWRLDDSWHTRRGLYLDWSVRGTKRETKGVRNWPGDLKLWPCYYSLLSFYNYATLDASCTSLPQKYIEHAMSIEDLSPYVPLYKVSEGNEPCFFKTYFSWDNTKSVVCCRISYTAISLCAVVYY